MTQAAVPAPSTSVTPRTMRTFFNILDAPLDLKHLFFCYSGMRTISTYPSIVLLGTSGNESKSVFKDDCALKCYKKIQSIDHSAFETLLY